MSLVDLPGAVAPALSAREAVMLRTLSVAGSMRAVHRRAGDNDIVDWDVDQFDEVTNESHDKETNG